MASVKRRNDSPFWVCCYRLKNGIRKQVSSGTIDKNTAMQMALRFEALADGWSKQKALDLIEEIAAAHGEQVCNPTPLCQYMPHWREARQADWAESSRKNFLAIERRFLREYGTMPIGRIEKCHVAEYRDGLQRDGRSRRTVQAHIKYLRRVFESALESGMIHENPAKISYPSPKPSRKQPFTIPQFKALLNATDGEWHLLILIAGLTGQRLQDVIALTHEQIESDAGRIRFRRAKTHDYHFVPLHASISESLQPGFGSIFPTLSELPRTGCRSASAKFRDDILPRIGIIQPYSKNLNGNKRVTEYSFHSLRHMLSTELNRIGASPETRMAIVGHDDQKVSASYTHTDFATATEMLARISL